MRKSLLQSVTCWKSCKKRIVWIGKDWARVPLKVPLETFGAREPLKIWDSFFWKFVKSLFLFFSLWRVKELKIFKMDTSDVSDKIVIIGNCKLHRFLDFLNTILGRVLSTCQKNSNKCPRHNYIVLHHG